MPKSKRRKRARSSQQQDIQWGGISARTVTRRERILVPLIIVVVLVVGAVVWWQITSTGRAFTALAEDGRPALRRVVTETPINVVELEPGAAASYPDRFPTAGAYAGDWTPPGFYDEPQEPAELVHSLRRGNVVAYIGRPRDEDLAVMRQWADRFDRGREGLVVTRVPGLGRGVVLTAWGRRLVLDDFDAAAMAAFLDAYRGRGPINRTR